MSRKVEDKVNSNLKIFVEFVNYIKDINYVFIGFFANIAYGHFRGCSFFELAVDEHDIFNIIEIAENNGFNVILYEENIEIFTEELMFKIRKYDKEDLLDKIQLYFNIDGHKFNLNFPNIELHTKILMEKDTIYGKIDAEKICDSNLDIKLDRLEHHFKLYFYFMYFNIEHNHINGSESCRLCVKRRG